MSIKKAMEKPRRPLVAVVGGAKISSKLGALENMLQTSARYLCDGLIASTLASIVDRGLAPWRANHK